MQKKGSSGPVTQWRQLLSCDWSWHPNGSLIPRRFYRKVNRSKKTPRQEYSGVACSNSSAPDTAPHCAMTGLFTDFFVRRKGIWYKSLQKVVTVIRYFCMVFYCCIPRCPPVPSALTHPLCLVPFIMIFSGWSSIPQTTINSPVYSKSLLCHMLVVLSSASAFTQPGLPLTLDESHKIGEPIGVRCLRQTRPCLLLTQWYRCARACHALCFLKNKGGY